MKTSRIRYMAVPLALLLLSGCSSLDMQGVDPSDYYAQNPNKNTVESRDMSILIELQRETGKLSASDIDGLRNQMGGVSLEAVQVIHVYMAPSHAKSETRQQYLKKLLRNMGYSRNSFTFAPSGALKSNEVRLDMTYAVVITPPNCPDWRMSPVSSHSNTWQGNFRCANEVNVGLMVADPNDLLGGAGQTETDTTRAAKAVQDFHAGRDFSAGASGSSDSSSSSTGGSAFGGNAAGTE